MGAGGEGRGGGGRDGWRGDEVGAWEGDSKEKKRGGYDLERGGIEAYWSNIQF